MRFNWSQLVRVQIGRLGHWSQLVRVKIDRLVQNGILADQVTSKIHQPDDAFSDQSLEDITHCYVMLVCLKFWLFPGQGLLGNTFIW